MEEFIIYGCTALFALLIFPFHLVNYIYLSTADKYASYNLTMYRFLSLFNANTIENKPQLMSINGKEIPIDIRSFNIKYFELIRKLCIVKVVQLEDFGINSEINACIAVFQNVMTQTVYELLNYADKGIKLKNYIILNCDGDSITYYLKAVNVANIISAAGIFLYIIRGKLNEFKA